MNRDGTGDALRVPEARPHPRPRLMRLAAASLLGLLAALLILQAAFSLAWPIAHDEAPMLYQAFAILTQGRLPYRGLVDFQMPGAYAAYYVLGLMSLFDPLRLRLLDLLLLAALSFITYRWMRPFGAAPAIAGPLLFGLMYLEGGASTALQRDFLLLLPIALGIWSSIAAGNSILRRVTVGLCFGIAALIKPHVSIALVPILLLDSAAPRRLAMVLATLAGFAVPFALTAMWMQVNGTLASFLDIAVHYWPLYAQINGQLVVVSGAQRWLDVLVEFWRFGGHAIWLVPAGLAAYLSLRTQMPPDENRHLVWLIVGMAIAFAIYPALSGQYFPYHYLPFMYFITALAALCLRKLEQLKWQPSAMAVLVGAALLDVRPSPLVLSQLKGKPLAGGRAAQMSSFLATHLEPGDTVQPLDWTGGALEAMLESRAPIATSFVFDFYLYHHVSSPYVQQLRARFINEIEAAQPAYIIEVVSMDKPWVAGPDTSREFPELREFLDSSYRPEVSRADYTIYRRR